MSQLFTPFNSRSLTLRNRIVVSPMCQYSAIDGLANDWHLVHLGSRATGGAGLVMAEATAVLPEGRITNGCLGLWSDEQIAPLQRITQFIKSQGAAAGIQLAHAGRKASCHLPWHGAQPIAPTEPTGWQTMAPSALPYRSTHPVPRAMTPEDIDLFIHSFEAAAIRALEAGFDMIEIHAAHGYLLNQFLSPLSNHRTDDYGGSFENRIRLLCRVAERVRSVWPAHLPLWVRISATEWADGGWTLDDSVALSIILKDLGVDLVDCSSGGNAHHQQIDPRPGYQVPLASAIRQQAGIATGAVGLITTAVQANNIVAEEHADVVLLARQLLRDPYFPLHAAKELGAEIGWPNQSLRAM
jgi:2,4-dienoyl-CoA reductase-like NADH-dependent reductase (Old Yellow Enzyme family)